MVNSFVFPILPDAQLSFTPLSSLLRPFLSYYLCPPSCLSPTNLPPQIPLPVWPTEEFWACARYPWGSEPPGRPLRALSVSSFSPVVTAQGKGGERREGPREQLYQRPCSHHQGRPEGERRDRRAAAAEAETSPQGVGERLPRALPQISLRALPAHTKPGESASPARAAPVLKGKPERAALLSGPSLQPGRPDPRKENRPPAVRNSCVSAPAAKRANRRRRARPIPAPVAGGGGSQGAPAFRGKQTGKSHSVVSVRALHFSPVTAAASASLDTLHPPLLTPTSKLLEAAGLPP